MSSIDDAITAGLLASNFCDETEGDLVVLQSRYGVSPMPGVFLSKDEVDFWRRRVIALVSRARPYFGKDGSPSGSLGKKFYYTLRDVAAYLQYFPNSGTRLV